MGQNLSWPCNPSDQILKLMPLVPQFASPTADSHGHGSFVLRRLHFTCRKSRHRKTTYQDLYGRNLVINSIRIACPATVINCHLTVNTVECRLRPNYWCAKKNNPKKPQNNTVRPILPFRDDNYLNKNIHVFIGVVYGEYGGYAYPPLFGVGYRTPTFWAYDRKNNRLSIIQRSRKPL